MIRPWETEKPKVVNDQKTLLKIQELRWLAWSANGEVPDFIAKQDILRDEHDKHGIHWTILHAGNVIAAARLCIHDDVASSPDPEALDGYEELVGLPVASLTRLVVHPEFRGQRLSNILDLVRISHAQGHGARSIVSIGEIEYRMRKLESLGFSRLGTTKIRYLCHSPSYVLLKRIGLDV